jgi:hypothetical protein
MRASLQSTLAAEARLTKGKFSLKEQTLNKQKYVIFRSGNRKLGFQKRTEFGIKVNVNKETVYRGKISFYIGNSINNLSVRKLRVVEI